MKRLIKGEKGYSLLLTVFISLLFTIFALALLTTTMSGIKKNKTTEEFVQARELSTKGIDHITNQIYQELNDALGETGLPRSAFIDQLNQTLNKYMCTSNKPIHETNRTGEYHACISKIENTKDVNGNDNPLRKKVTFISIGNANGKEKEITATFEIGSQAVPDTLHYVLGANKLCTVKKDCLPGEGNMFLHGGVSIVGDFKVDGNLIITNRGYAYLGGEKWIDSLYPSALPTKNKKQSHLVLGGNVYTFDHKPSYQAHIQANSFGSGYINKTKNIAEAFHNGEAPVIVKRETIREPIPISSQKEVFYYKYNSPGVTVIGSNSSSETFSGFNMPNDKAYASHRECILIILCHTKYDGNYQFIGNNTFGNFATQGNLTIKNNKNNFGKTTFLRGAYIAGNLTIGNGNDSYNPNNYDKVQIEGSIFVDGNVTIKGADAEFHSIMYVTGNVTIEYSRINGLNVNGKEGSLIIFAKGDINIRNNSVNQDEPSEIKGYFYSEQALEMFGVGSNIRIEGGISARRIVLNAIRGRASDRSFPGAQKITNNDYFEGVTGQMTRNSRLQIIYDPEIINTYADLKSKEPIITSIDRPIIIDRKINE